ncbi:UPF0147 family protein [Candidatus Woesearchaeota archaeon]|nr:UPF0147 family protein [Candidatus Woesearchaeota archaeon]
MENREIDAVMSVLNELKEDNTVPKNVRLKIEDAVNILNEDTGAEIKASRVLSKLEEIADDVNLQTYTRTQIWDAISLLEKIK